MKCREKSNVGNLIQKEHCMREGIFTWLHVISDAERLQVEFQKTSSKSFEAFFTFIY